MKTLPLLSLLILVVAAASCKVIQPEDLRPDRDQVQPLLPPLEPLLDQRSLDLSYDLANTSTSGDASGIGLPVGAGVFIGASDFNSRSVTSADKRIRDLSTLWERDVISNMTAGGQPLGSIVLTIPFKETRPVAMGWTVLSGLTLFIPNIFGMPIIKHRTELELEALILDCKDQVIGRYLGYGNAKATMSTRGYGGDLENLSGNDPLSRKSHLDAVKQALAQIKTEINKDGSRVSTQLRNCTVGS